MKRSRYITVHRSYDETLSAVKEYVLRRKKHDRGLRDNKFWISMEAPALWTRTRFRYIVIGKIRKTEDSAVINVVVIPSILSMTILAISLVMLLKAGILWFQYANNGAVVLILTIVNLILMGVVIWQENACLEKFNSQLQNMVKETE